MKMKYLKHREDVESWVNYYVKLDGSVDVGGYKKLVIEVNSIPSWYTNGKKEYENSVCGERLVEERDFINELMYEHFIDYMSAIFESNRCELLGYSFDEKSEYPDYLYGLIKTTIRTLVITFREN
jgi:hypothetical protein